MSCREDGWHCACKFCTHTHTRRLHDGTLSNRIPIMKTADIPTIECHPPERRRRTGIRMCHGCCCCCCCCLHTVGGILGAVIAPKLGGRSTAWSHLSLIEE